MFEFETLENNRSDPIMASYLKSWESFKEGAKSTMAATKEKMQNLKETTQEKMVKKQKK